MWLLAALAALLGGLHALTPAHGKTLVGSRGMVRHAVALGAVVTVTHTASVIGIGLLALLAGQWIVPTVLVPTLEIFSGLLVVALGARLVGQRWTAFRRRWSTDPDPAPDPDHRHNHVHTQDDQHSDDHAGDHAYAHTHP